MYVYERLFLSLSVSLVVYASCSTWRAPPRSWVAKREGQASGAAAASPSQYYGSSRPAAQICWRAGERERA